MRNSLTTGVGCVVVLGLCVTPRAVAQNLPVAGVSAGDAIAAAPITAIATAVNEAGWDSADAGVSVFRTGTVTINTGNLDLDASTATTGNLLKDGVRFLHNFGPGNTFLGVLTGNFTLTGISNTGVGTEALQSLTDGSENTAHGRAALSLTTSGNHNTALGSSALVRNRTGSSNTAVGHEALLFNTSSDNTAVGKGALRATTDGDNNTAVGKDALGANQTGASNTAVGHEALLFNTSSDNTAVGKGALQMNSSGKSNTALGRATLEDNMTGSNNTAVGEGALRNSTGDDNTALGRTAGRLQTTGSNTIYIGHLGVAAESNTTRLGRPGVHVRTFVSGIAGVTTDVDDAVAVLIDTAGQLGTASSSLRYKKDVLDMGTASEGLQRLRPVTFRYKQARAGGQRLEYGLIAEEVAAVFPDIVVYDDAGRPETVQYRKVNAMLLNEVQHQHQRIGDLERQLATVLGRLAALEGRTTSGEE